MLQANCIARNAAGTGTADYKTPCSGTYAEHRQGPRGSIWVYQNLKGKYGFNQIDNLCGVAEQTEKLIKTFS